MEKIKFQDRFFFLNFRTDLQLFLTIAKSVFEINLNPTFLKQQFQEPEFADYVPQIDQFVRNFIVYIDNHENIDFQVRYNPTEDVRWYSIENDLYKGYDFK